MLTIRELTRNELEQLYTTHFLNDFAHADLLRPYERMTTLLERNKYIAFGFFGGDKLAAYTLLALQDEILFLDFFAVLKGLRGTGVGSEVLLLLQQRFPAYAIVIEVENIDCAEDEKDRVIREKRVHFYEKNGFLEIPLGASLFGDKYIIMTRNCNMPVSKIAKILEEIYISLYSTDIYPEKVKLLI